MNQNSVIQLSNSEDNFSPAKLLKLLSDIDEMHPQSRFIIPEPSLWICRLLISLNSSIEETRCQVANAFFLQMHINQKSRPGLSRRACGCVCVRAVIMRSLSPSNSRGHGDCWQGGVIRTRGDTGLLSPGYLTLSLPNAASNTDQTYEHVATSEGEKKRYTAKIVIINCRGTERKKRECKRKKKRECFAEWATGGTRRLNPHSTWWVGVHLWAFV